MTKMSNHAGFLPRMYYRSYAMCRQPGTPTLVYPNANASTIP